jgi:nucleotide-binding universal stress UspA family protein
VQNRVLVYADALDVAAEGAVWYARKVGAGSFDALHVPGKHTDSGIYARWFEFTGGDPRLDVRPAGTDAQQAVLEAIARLRGSGDDVVVTVVLPEQFSKRSLFAAAQRAQFRLKLRLLTEPGVVVADVPAVTSERRPGGRVPERLVVRVIAGEVDDATRRAIDYASGIGADDLRAVHFGERSWGDDDLGLPVDDAPLDGRLGESILDYVRRLTSDETAAVNVVLPERLHANLPRLRGRRAIAVKRCLLFEPHVILSNVPMSDG